MTVQVTLTSMNKPASYRFTLDADPPPAVLSLGESLSWEAVLTNVSGIPARFAHATLSSGAKLVDLPARVSFSIGTAYASGQEVYGEEAVWGHLYVDYGGEGLSLCMHVSRGMIRRLAHFCEMETIPDVTVELRENEALHTSKVDGRLERWEEDKLRYLVVEWCHFTTDIPLKRSEGA